MRTCILTLLLILFPAGRFLAGQTPELSPESTISLITCGPGPEVYTYFGHSALRVKDPVLRLDRVYNYGTFDFNIPDFYAKFIDGKLYYMLSVVRYQGFVPDYIQEKRFIKELPLNITQEEKQELFRLLEINYLPENRHYWYDFFLDNCSTRVRDIVARATGGKYLWPAEPADHLTYRQLIMPYISLNSWSRTGILLMLAGGADKESTQEGYMFLPDHLHRLFALAQQADGTPLCKPEKIIFMPEFPKTKGVGLMHPYAAGGLVLIISWFLFFYGKTPARLFRTWQTLLLLVSGLLGAVFLYMWLFSGHLVCHANINLAWAFPLNFLFAVTLWFTRASRVNRLYSKAMLVLIILFLLTFWFMKQKVPLEAILISVSLLPGFLRFSGLEYFSKAKTQNQTN